MKDILASIWFKLGTAALALALLFALYRCGHSSGVQDERDRAAAVEAERGAAATNRATAERDRLDNIGTADATNMQGAINNAVQSDPQGARQPVGNATGAALDELRRRNAPAQPR